VYGPADHEKSGGFLLEIGEYCRSSVLPIIIGGDFNLIRSESDKSNGVGDRHLMNAFNCFIEECELREMHRGGQICMDK
jgi:hypothetical protein